MFLDHGHRISGITFRCQLVLVLAPAERVILVLDAQVGGLARSGGSVRNACIRPLSIGRFRGPFDQAAVHRVAYE